MREITAATEGRFCDICEEDKPRAVLVWWHETTWVCRECLDAHVEDVESGGAEPDGPEGSVLRYSSLDAFVTVNADDEGTCEGVRALAVGESVDLGGGACPAVRVRRVTERTVEILDLDAGRVAS